MWDITKTWAFPFSRWRDSYTLIVFLHFHALSRSIWWSSNPTSSEVPRLDGEPQSAQSRVCVSKKIRSFPAEVGLPWTSLSLLLPLPVLVPQMLRLRSCSEQQRGSPYMREAYFVEGARSVASPLPLPCTDWTSLPKIASAVHLQVQIALSRHMAYMGRPAPRWRGCAGEASRLQTGRIQNGTVSSSVFLIWDYESLDVHVIAFK